jgi:hypothetical protein
VNAVLFVLMGCSSAGSPPEAVLHAEGTLPCESDADCVSNYHPCYADAVCAHVAEVPPTPDIVCDPPDFAPPSAACVCDATCAVEPP